MIISFKQFSRLFFTLLLLHIVILAKEPESAMVYITKPTLLISLIAYYLKGGWKTLTYYQKLFAAGLVFSLFGDVFLLEEEYFILGLGSFLIAHLCYSFAFFRSNNESNGWLKKYPMAALPALVFGFGMIYYLFPYLDEMEVPVIVYTSVITIMLTLAINRNKNTSKESFNLVLLGATLFVVSDSILAVNKFYSDLDMARPATMLTYGLAQYFLVWGMLKANQR